MYQIYHNKILCVIDQALHAHLYELIEYTEIHLNTNGVRLFQSINLYWPSLIK